MTSSIFSCAYLQSCYVFRSSIYLNILPTFFTGLFVFSLLCFENSLYILDTSTLWSLSSWVLCSYWYTWTYWYTATLRENSMDILRFSFTCVRHDQSSLSFRADFERPPCCFGPQSLSTLFGGHSSIPRSEWTPEIFLCSLRIVFLWSWAVFLKACPDESSEED